MTTTTTVSFEPAVRGEPRATRQQIRGSSLLLAGRVLSKGVNFAAQVMIVRYLSQTDFGAFAYALAMVQLVQGVATFGLDRAMMRFLPMYQERQDYGRLFGTVFLALGTVLSVGLLAALLVHLFQFSLVEPLIRDPQALSLLLLLVFLAPVQAIDDLLVGLFATFADAQAIFFRKHVLAPGLKFLVVLLLVLGNQSVMFLAFGYLMAAVLGVAIYALLLFRLLRSQDLFAHFNLKSIRLPWREIFAFTIPLLTSDLVYLSMNAVDVMLLQYFQDVAGVAAFRAVQPAAFLNQVVMASFATLFVPAASRLLARNDKQGVNDLYWQTAVWIAVFSFPIFVLTFSLARPVTVLLYGARYEQSASVLALLSLGYYFNASLGLNGLTLKVYGRLRYVVTMNLFVAVVNVLANLLLIPRYGVMGAAIGTCGTLILHNLLKQAGLWIGTGIEPVQRRYLKIYVTIALCALGTALIPWLTSAPLYASVALAVAASLLVIATSRRLLDIEQVFPELLRFPWVRRLLGARGDTDA